MVLKTKAENAVLFLRIKGATTAHHLGYDMVKAPKSKLNIARTFFTSCKKSKTCMRFCFTRMILESKNLRDNHQKLHVYFHKGMQQLGPRRPLLIFSETLAFVWNWQALPLLWPPMEQLLSPEQASELSSFRPFWS
jgi:hypothetical protein